MFSARPGDYLVATQDNVLYGVPVSGRPERRLSPGIVAPVLALAGLLLVDTTVVFIAYVIGLALAFEMSLGAHGVLYPLLYEHVTLFRGLRAPARASVFCLFFLGILAAQAVAALTRLAPSSAGKWALCAVLCLAVLFEYRVSPLALVEYPNEPTPVYKVFRNLPPGIVAEFPMPRPDSPPFNDPKYAYMSTFHWMPLLNGYSGFYPQSYLRRLARLREFPDEESVASLRRENTRYLIIHEDGYPEGERLRIVNRLLTLGTRRIADFQDGWGLATLMELQ